MCQCLLRGNIKIKKPNRINKTIKLYREYKNILARIRKQRAQKYK